jgi:cell division protein FtsB
MLEFVELRDIIAIMLSPAHIKYIFLSILLIFGMFNFTRTTMDIIQTSKRLQNMQDNVAGLETKKKTLERDLSYKKTSRFVEEEARNRLNMIKKGEKVLVLPVLAQKDLPTTSANLAPSIKNTSESDTDIPDENNSHFWQWVELFL